MENSKTPAQNQKVGRKYTKKKDNGTMNNSPPSSFAKFSEMSI